MSTTYLMAYGIRKSYDTNGNFVPLSELFVHKWGLNAKNKSTVLGGRWKDASWNATKENYFEVTEINGVKKAPAEIPAALLAEAKRGLAEYKDIEHIVLFACNSEYTGYCYPILTTDQASSIRRFGKAIQYPAIARYALASNIAYALNDLTKIEFQDDQRYKDLMLPARQKLEILDQINGGKAGIHALAIKVPAVKSLNLKEEIIISYKGTSNAWDAVEDLRLVLQNFIELDKSWQKEAYDFCQRVVQKHQGDGLPFTLTGHSLGAYTAIQVAARTGLLARTFSSPATRISDNPKITPNWKALVFELSRTMLQNTLWRNNALNFVRLKDPIVFGSGRHDENMVYFKEAGKGTGLFGSHSLSDAIKDIYLPNAFVATKVAPQYVYVQPNIELGAGLTAPVCKWGKAT